VNELRAEGITTPGAANRYLRERFLPALNLEFRRAPSDPASASVPLGRVDLAQILCHQDERVVARDNTVQLDGLRLQLAKAPGPPPLWGPARPGSPPSRRPPFCVAWPPPPRPLRRS